MNSKNMPRIKWEYSQQKECLHFSVWHSKVKCHPSYMFQFHSISCSGKFNSSKRCPGINRKFLSYVELYVFSDFNIASKIFLFSCTNCSISAIAFSLIARIAASVSNPVKFKISFRQLGIFPFMFFSILQNFVAWLLKMQFAWVELSKCANGKNNWRIYEE